MDFQRAVEAIMMTGTTNDYIKTTNLTFASGRFFNELESNGSRNVCVMADMTEKLSHERLTESHNFVI